LGPLTAVAEGPPKTIEGECIFFDKFLVVLDIDVVIDGVLIKAGTEIDVIVKSKHKKVVNVKAEVLLALNLDVSLEANVKILSVGFAADCFDPHIKFIN
jgi:hypothetical protein